MFSSRRRMAASTSSGISGSATPLPRHVETESCFNPFGPWLPSLQSSTHVLCAHIFFVLQSEAPVQRYGMLTVVPSFGEVESKLPIILSDLKEHMQLQGCFTEEVSRSMRFHTSLHRKIS
jgi:hypothetical protein